MSQPLARDVVDRQLVAYNAHDLDGFCALFAADAVIETVGEVQALARGSAEIRTRYAARFANNPGLHCELVSRLEFGAFVIDKEHATGLDGGEMTLVAIYEVRSGKIQSLRFIWPDARS